jgi:NAD(P)H-dependent FMN reductase
MLKLAVIIVSTRPGRKGPALAQWFADFARHQEIFDVTLIDLAEVNLPLLDEPAHPRLQQYQHAHTQAWSELIAAQDAFVFVSPEYNFGTPAPLVNALDYLFKEWNYKPAGFVSYGGVSGGLRGVQMTKLLLTALKMMPIPEAVSIPAFSDHIDANGTFQANSNHEHSADGMLNELRKWAAALKNLR